MNFVGVDVGGTNISASSVDTKSGEIGQRVKVSTPSDPLLVFDAICDLVNDLDIKVKGIGIGVPGPVTNSGHVTCVNIPGWDRPIKVGEEINRRTNVPIAVENDVNCGAVGEFKFGAGREVSNMLAMFLGTGVGGGLIVNNKLVTGSRGISGEVGHMITSPNGKECSCGALGHLESYAGKSGIDREVRFAISNGEKTILEPAEGVLKSSEIFDAYQANDKLTIDLMEDAIAALKIALTNITVLTDIDLVVLGGGMAEKFGHLFIERLSGFNHFGKDEQSEVKICLAERIDNAGNLGAACLAADLIGS